MRLSWRIAGFTIVIVVVANLLSLGVVAMSVRWQVEADLARELDHASEALRDRLDREGAILDATTAALANEPMMRAVLGTADVDAVTLTQVTEAAREGLGLDALLLLGPSGEVLAASPASARPAAAPSAEARALVLGDGEAYVVRARPVQVGGAIVGGVLGAQRVDQELVDGFARDNDVGVVLRVGAHTVGEALSSGSADEVVARRYADGEIAHVSAKGAELLVTSVRVAEGVEALLVRDRDAAFQRFNRTLARLAAVGFVSVVVAGGLAALVARGVTRPLQRVSSAASRIAGGDLSDASVRELPSADESSADEAVQLAGTFRRMVGELRRSREDLERYASSLEVEVQNAKAADLAKSAFLANMSHELRTPLNAIIGYSEMLREDAQARSDTQAVDDLDRIHGAGSHLLTLINAVLDLSKIQAGRMDVSIEDVDVRSAVEEAADTVRPMAQKRGNRLLVWVPPDAGSIRADVVKVRQVLLNLLSNATKFTDRGEVAVQVHLEPEAVVFEVRDSGIGMDETQLSRLFQEFSQADASTTRKYGGTGLGLAISQRFCQMMGGEITVESRLGRGSTFRARLPRVVRRVRASDPQVLVGQGASVVVCDDDEAVRSLLVRMLTKEGYTALGVASGPELLEVVRQVRPTAITLDVEMPGTDGWQVLVALKSDSALADIPVVMISVTEAADRGFALGADEFLTKPVDRTRLRNALARHRSGEGPVLVVDDDPAVRAVLHRMLEREGLRVVEATHGREALDAIARQRPQLVLLDLMMPEMDGFQFLDALRATDMGELPVIVLTAMDVEGDVGRELRQKAAVVLEKAGYDRQRLLAEVRAQVHKQVRRVRSEPVAV